MNEHNCSLSNSGCILKKEIGSILCFSFFSLIRFPVKRDALPFSFPSLPSVILLLPSSFISHLLQQSPFFLFIAYSSEQVMELISKGKILMNEDTDLKLTANDSIQPLHKQWSWLEKLSQTENLAFTRSKRFLKRHGKRRKVSKLDTSKSMSLSFLFNMKLMLE